MADNSGENRKSAGSLLVTAGAFAVFTLGLKIVTPSGILF